MPVALTCGLGAAVIASVSPYPQGSRRPRLPVFFRWIPVGLLAGLVSCTGDPRERFNSVETPSHSFRPNTESERPRSDSPPVLLNREPIASDDLFPLLAEAAGVEVLQSVLLDRLVGDECGRRGIVITPEAILAEEAIMLESLHSDPATSARLLEELRQRRRLGSRRYDLLLTTNARLRALVRDEVTVDPSQIRVEYARRFGPRYDIRILTHPDHATMVEALSRLRQDESFIDLVIELSTDISADRGGLIGPISPVDPEFPQAIRQVLADLNPGEVAPIISLETGFCLVQVVRKRPGIDMPLESVEDDIAQSLRRAMERQRMNALAIELIGEAEVIVLDPALHDAWRGRERR